MLHLQTFMSNYFQVAIVQFRLRLTFAEPVGVSYTVDVHLQHFAEAKLSLTRVMICVAFILLHVPQRIKQPRGNSMSLTQLCFIFRPLPLTKVVIPVIDISYSNDICVISSYMIVMVYPGEENDSKGQ